MSTILVVEDDFLLREAYARSLPEHEFLMAATTRQGRGLFITHQNRIAIVVLDGYLEGDPEHDTTKFAAEIRAAGFTGPMIAASGDAKMREKLMHSCDHSIIHSKNEVPNLVQKILHERGVLSNAHP